jgi:hypothetical protein
MIPSHTSDVILQSDKVIEALRTKSRGEPNYQDESEEKSMLQTERDEEKENEEWEKSQTA